MKGSKAVLESLKKEGVEKVFGYPGGAVINLYDSLSKEDSIDHILTKHEQGAAHAADAYSRVSGKPGVCIATSGPGATNLVTGIANAHMDSVPLVAITGQVPTEMIGTDAFQEADMIGISMPITKHNYLIKEPNKLTKTFREAFKISNAGRKGPVLIDLPKDIQNSEIKFSYKDVDIRGYKPTREGHPLQIKKAAKAIMEADRPVMYVGGGVIASEASNEVRELAELTMSPVTTTLMAKGSFDEEHPLSLGMLGMHGTKAANYAITEADLVLAIGARFDDRVTGKIEGFAPNAKMIHIDIDPAEIGKNVEIDIPIVGDAKKVLNKLLKRIKNYQIEKKETEWHRKINRWKKEFPLSYSHDGKRIPPQFVVEKIDEKTPDDTIIATEVGQCQMWAAQFYTFTKPRTWITSGGLGTMGYGLPAAIGAQVAEPEKVIWNIAGDGSIQMNIQELATAVQYDLPINVAILNNNYLGMVRQWQELFFDKRYSQTELKLDPDFVKLAEAYGAEGRVIEKESEVEEVIEEATETDKPYLIDFRVEEEENVLPMVPAGASLSEVLGKEDLE